MEQAKIKDYVLKKLHEGDVRVHITKINYPSDVKYNASCGVYVDNELDDVFELENISNNEIDEFMKDLNIHIRKNTLFLI